MGKVKRGRDRKETTNKGITIDEYDKILSKMAIRDIESQKLEREFGSDGGDKPKKEMTQEEKKAAKEAAKARKQARQQARLQRRMQCEARMEENGRKEFLKRISIDTTEEPKIIESYTRRNDSRFEKRNQYEMLDERIKSKMNTTGKRPSRGENYDILIASQEAAEERRIDLAKTINKLQKQDQSIDDENVL